MCALPAMPITNFLLRRYAIHLRESGRLEELAAKARAEKEASAKGEVKKKLITVPAFLQENQLFTLFMVLVGGAIATLISGWTYIPSSLVALVLGVASTAIGLTPERALEKASSFGFAMAAVVAVVMAPLVRASMEDVLTALIPMLVILVVGMVGIMLGGFLATKLLGWRPALGMSVALTAMYGFPADYLLTNEVARSSGRDETERQQLLDAMLPAMLVGGFSSVSAGSVVIASVLVSFL